MDKIEKETLVSDNKEDSTPSNNIIDLSEVNPSDIPAYNRKFLPANDEAPFGYTSSGKPRKRPLRNDLSKFGEENTDVGDNSKFLKYAMASWKLPKIDISDPKQVEDRIYKYFEYCYENDRKPSIVGMANWLGVSRETLNSWKRGDTRNATHTDTVQKAIQLMEEQWVDYMMNGKVNPASGIFLGKNFYQYKDVIDIKPVAPDPLGEQVSAKELADKYKDIIEE